ncbi:MAG TPA: hypothetical protein DCL54_12000 [Alphaproteobacteria bacterium]|nr:hypothetical protein [Alphaproteobacteria bacterium]HAJ47290.1 hypothetical protein [Alphaproteobacteria bacterium]
MSMVTDVLGQHRAFMAKGRELCMAQPWRERAFYENWLGQMYYFVAQSTRLIPFAAAHFDTDHEASFRRCLDHAKEEAGHEQQVINDLRALGRRIEEFEELPSTYLMHQGQFHLISRVHPASFFGISLYMEGLSLAAGQEICDAVLPAHGRAAASFLICHTQEDEQHTAQAISQVKQLPADAQVAVVRSMRLAHFCFSGMFDGVRQMAAPIPVAA